MPLYNCKPEGSSHRITKFDSDFNVESSYITDGQSCECPAGHRDTCRHRQMLPRFLAKGAGTGQWFHNFEAKSWVRAEAEVDFEPETLGDLTSEAREVTGPLDITATEIDEQFRNYKGPVPGDDMIEAVVDHAVKTINLLALATPLRFNKDYSNSIGHSPAHDALPPKPLRRL